MAYQLFRLPKAVGLDSAVRALSGARAYFYATGTTTPQDTYSDSALTTTHANPVVADASGVFPPIYLDPSLEYKLTLNTSADALIYTVDPVNDQLRYGVTERETSAGLDIGDYSIATAEAAGVVYLSRYLGWDPTGATSSRSAFNNALELIYEQGANHVSADQIGGRIIVPYGIALLDDTVTIGADNIQIIGGHGATIKTNDAFYAFTVDSTDLVKVFGTRFHGLRFISTISARDADSGAIRLVAAEKWLVEQCRFHLRTEHGIRLTDTIVGRVNDCQFDSGSAEVEGMEYGIYSEATNSVQTSGGSNVVAINGCSFGRTTEAAVALLGQPVSNSPTLLRKESSGDSVTQCHFEHNYGDGIQLTRNRAYTIHSNWFEAGGKDEASGRGFIMDKATDDDEGGSGANSGQNAVVSIAHNVFGGHDDANADFEHIGLSFCINPIIEKNYFTSGIIGISSNCAGLVFRDNWAAESAPTLSGTLPTKRYVSNNRRGPSASLSASRAWGGSFADYNADTLPYVAVDEDTTPSLLTENGERIHTLLVSNTSATSITFFDDGYDGQILRVIATTANTTLVNGGDNAINLAGDANFAMGTSDTVTLQLVVGSGGFANRWIELSRSDNST